jgi:hypothetical protein
MRLRGLRLIRITAEGVIPLPAVGRYASVYEGANKVTQSGSTKGF